MKNNLLTSIILVCLLSPMGISAKEKPRSINRQSHQNFVLAIEMAKSGKYIPASDALFKLSMRPEFENERMHIKYVLGLMLFELKMYQTAAFQFVDVVREGKSKYIQLALEKLAIAADQLNDDTLLNYAISKVNIDEFPEVHRDMLYFRVGEYKLNAQQYNEAAVNFARVKGSSQFFERAKYLQGLAYAEGNQAPQAIKVFDELLARRTGYGVTDQVRVLALISKARALYQNKEWDKSLELYRDVPRDTEYWHDALFESTWGYLRAAKFRTALSNFHSLHSSYYEDHYNPESLILRAIVYLYICKYDEMEKVLELFEKSYGNVKNKVGNYLNTRTNPLDTFSDLEGIAETVSYYKRTGVRPGEINIPFVVGRSILKEGNVRRTLTYLRKLEEERIRLEKMPASWREASVGQYTKRIIANRMSNTRELMGKQVQNHLQRIKTELVDLFEQADLVRYEMLNGKKELLKKKLAGKGLEEVTIDSNKERDFYIQNGYQFWPFQGEYWLDEIGNYHYLGTQSCE